MLLLFYIHLFFYIQILLLQSLRKLFIFGGGHKRGDNCQNDFFSYSVDRQKIEIICSGESWSQQQHRGIDQQLPTPAGEMVRIFFLTYSFLAFDVNDIIM